MRLEEFQDAVCPECGKGFECLRLDQKYCSVACRKRSNVRANNAARDERRRRERMGMTCRQCGGKFNGVTGFQRYCGAACRTAAAMDVRRKARRPAPRRDKTCAACGRDFNAKSVTQKFCCASCRYESFLANAKQTVRAKLAAMRCQRCGGSMPGAVKTDARYCRPCSRAAMRERGRNWMRRKRARNLSRNC
jgi:hypothetical protein